MPAPGSSCAPDFDLNHPEELRDFLEEFEEHAVACGLDTKEKSKVVVRYTDVKTKRFWKSLEGYDLGERFTANHLVKLITKLVDSDIYNENDLNAYYCDFWPIASYLVDTKKINNNDCNCYFWKGLPLEAQKAIQNHLENEDSTFDCAQVLSIEKAMKVGQFMFSKEAVDDDDEDPIMEIVSRRWKKGGKGRKEWVEDVSEEEQVEDSSEEERRRVQRKEKSGRKEVRTRAVRFEKRKDTKDKVEELTRKLHGLDMRDASYASTYARLVMVAPILAEQIPPPTHWMTGMATTNTLGIPSQPKGPRYTTSPHQFTTTAPYDPSCHFCK
ncbi:hypothetical protein P691DRAFT_793249 [Macrolepiota fuliginosa MF-IS2]|uniref:Uncharacterized protein n=1 Tax=Macrolepiota fuliginosa MF-IS2 TaxID=1400762 RepID=A0A9P5X091_9AGAR|nr:hypothetical protein P691DRAFT_793249 [Macrolepiota fuliginosa MF-IS2]